MLDGRGELEPTYLDGKCNSTTMLTKEAFLIEEAPPEMNCGSQHASIDAALLTGGIDRPYAYGLAMALVEKNVHLDVIGSDVVDSAEMHTTPHLRFFNLWAARSAKAPPFAKASRIVGHYLSLIRYAAVCATARVSHLVEQQGSAVRPDSFDGLLQSIGKEGRTHCA